MFNFFVPQKNLNFVPKTNIVTGPIAFIAIWSMIFLIVIADVSTSLYQMVYFSIMKIPKIPRSKYVKIHRHKLKKIGLLQKASCAYCEYANGIIAWCGAVANQTEKYSCAIKYKHEYPGQEYQAEFYDPRDFE